MLLISNSLQEEEDHGEEVLDADASHEERVTSSMNGARNMQSEDVQTAQLLDTEPLHQDLKKEHKPSEAAVPRILYITPSRPEIQSDQEQRFDIHASRSMQSNYLNPRATKYSESHTRE